MGLTEDAALDELFAIGLDDFTARRNELAKELRAAGDGDAADRVKTLKKPTAAAWAVNRFGATKGKPRKELLAAGAGLRKAHEKLVAGKADREGVRKATERERVAVDAARDAVATLARKAGVDLSSAALDRVAHTLHAIALDDDVRSEFEAGRLTTDHEGIGLGGLGLAAAPSPRGGRAAGKETTAKERKRRETLKAAESDLRELERRDKQANLSETAARDAAERAQRDLKHASKERKAAAAALAKARERVSSLRKS